MAHHATYMPGMKDPAERFGECIRRVNDAGDVAHNDITRFFPVLDSEELDVNMSSAFGRYAVVNHEDRGHIVFVDGSRGWLLETEFLKDSAQVAGLFGSGDSSDEFSLSRASGRERLSFGTVGDGATSEKENVAGSGATFAQVIGVGGIDKADKFIEVNRREVREVIGNGKYFVRRLGQSRIGLGLLVDDTPVDSAA